jgi:hypothetical protein
MLTNIQIEIENILKELLIDKVELCYSDPIEDIVFVLTDYKDDYYILCALPKRELEQCTNELKNIKAWSDCRIVFQAGKYPKSEKRLFYSVNSEREHLNYEDWKKAFELGIDKYIKR